MMMAATCRPGALARSDVVACIPHLRAFAAVITGDRRRADDLVGEAIEQTFAVENRPRAADDLKVQILAALHRLHYGAQLLSTERMGQQRNPPSSKEDRLEPDALLRIFGRLRDERREALILTIASGLSYQQAAEVCGCAIAVIESRVSEAWSDMSRALREASLERKTSFATSYLPNGLKA